ncbi:MAG: hypothetical protein M3P87_02855 [Actinomycetota bacterium]|nr:hypothetical protein [Actinomycetota bacterium]
MRRALVPFLCLVTFAMALPAVADEDANFKDKFDSISWGGSNGSLPWSGPWLEIGDDGDEKKSNVRVVSSGNCASGNCIRFSALTTLLGSIGAERSADTSVLEDAELCFDLMATESLFGSQLLVQVNGGGGWVTVATYNLGAEQTDHPTIDISDYRSADFSLRFEFSGALLSSEVFIDNVEITGEMIEETTTTTTAPPTTTTTSPTTTTAPTTTTTRPTTTTTRPPSTTTVFDGESPTTTVTGDTSSTTPPDDSSASGLITTGDDDQLPPGSDGLGGSGIRQAARGLQANFDSGLFGEVSAISPITGVDFQARFTMAVEIIEASWAWMVLLGLVIAWSIVSGMERRRAQLLR